MARHVVDGHGVQRTDDGLYPTPERKTRGEYIADFHTMLEIGDGPGQAGVRVGELGGPVRRSCEVWRSDPVRVDTLRASPRGGGARPRSRSAAGRILGVVQRDWVASTTPLRGLVGIRERS